MVYYTHDIHNTIHTTHSRLCIYKDVHVCAHAHRHACTCLFKFLPYFLAVDNNSNKSEMHQPKIGTLMSKAAHNLILKGQSEKLTSLSYNCCIF